MLKRQLVVEEDFCCQARCILMIYRLDIIFYKFYLFYTPVDLYGFVTPVSLYRLPHTCQLVATFEELFGL
jgi:hypothetical protein